MHSCCATFPQWALHTHLGFTEHIQEDFTHVPGIHRIVSAKAADLQRSWTKVLQLLGNFEFTGCTRKNRSAHVMVAFQDACILTVPSEIIAALHSITLPTVYQTLKSWKKQPKFWGLAWTKFQYRKRRLDHGPWFDRHYPFIEVSKI